jgi:hypothetical protein
MVKHIVNDSDRKGARLVLLYSVIMLLVMVYLMIGSWPAATEDLDLNATSTFDHTTPALNQINDINSTRIITLPALGSFFVGPETLLVIIMMISGAMGACLFSIWAASHHLGTENDFDYVRYRAWYFTRPFLGAGIAFIFYLLVRGGLLTIGEAVLALNIVVIAGLSGLVGMFSEQALLKLLEVADALFGPAKKAENPETEAAEELDEAKKAVEEAKKEVENAKKKAAKAKEEAQKAKQKADASKSPKDAEAAEKAQEKEKNSNDELERATEKAEKAATKEKEAAEKVEALSKKKTEDKT